MNANAVKFSDMQVGDTVDFEAKSKAVRQSPASGIVTKLTNLVVTVKVREIAQELDIRRSSLVMERRSRNGGRYHWVFQ